MNYEDTPLQPESEPRRLGRPRASSFRDEPRVCDQRGCFNYVEHVGDKYCAKHTPPQSFTTQLPRT